MVAFSSDDILSAFELCESEDDFSSSSEFSLSSLLSLFELDSDSKSSTSLVSYSEALSGDMMGDSKDGCLLIAML